MTGRSRVWEACERSAWEGHGLKHVRIRKKRVSGRGVRGGPWSLETVRIKRLRYSRRFLGGFIKWWLARRSFSTGVIYGMVVHAIFRSSRRRRWRRWRKSRHLRTINISFVLTMVNAAITIHRLILVEEHN